MAEIKLTELDFDRLKENLKTYLRGRAEFEDYDFNASSLSYLLDILSYYTTIESYYMHMIANESFLDTAQYRANVVSKAKAIGYVPTSAKSSVAYIDVIFTPGNAPVSIYVPENTKFTSRIDNKTYNFHTREAYTVYPQAGLYELLNMKLYQGIRLTHKYTMDNLNYMPDSQFVIPNVNVDTELLVVKVQDSESSNIIQTYRIHDDINELNSESKVFFLNEGLDGKYQISFGDGVLGKRLEQGNVVIIDYVVSAGSSSNGCNLFSPSVSIGGITNTSISTKTAATGGSEQEDIESIRKLAPLSYQSQNRLVTKQDFETIVQKDYPAIDSIRVWGGEENSPPIYGKVFISVKPSDGIELSNTLKQNIINQYIKPKNMISIEVEMVDPAYLYLDMNLIINYDSRLTVDSANAVKETVLLATQQYNDDNLNKFDKDYKNSVFLKVISDAHPAIQDVLVSNNLKALLYPMLMQEKEYKIDFSNVLSPLVDEFGNNCLSTTGFKYKGFNCFLRDDTFGNVHVYKIVEGVKLTVKENIGTIDYTNGILHLKKFYADSILSGDEYIELTVRLKSANIYSKQNQILILSDKYLTIDMNDLSIG